MSSGLRCFSVAYGLGLLFLNGSSGSLRQSKGELILFPLASDDASQMDLFHQDADNDEENEEHLDEAEAKWRKERFEREQWLREQVTGGAWFAVTAWAVSLHLKVFRESLGQYILGPGTTF